MLDESRDRYAGKPLKRLIECFILWAIDELPETECEKLRQIAPKLREIYGIDGEWNEVVAGALHFPPDMRQEIRSMWELNRKIASENGATLEPGQFAMMFVDSNFPS